jgi:hypothetical protein
MTELQSVARQGRSGLRRYDNGIRGESSVVKRSEAIKNYACPARQTDATAGHCRYETIRAFRYGCASREVARRAPSRELRGPLTQVAFEIFLTA